jgi:hypothetical protein
VELDNRMCWRVLGRKGIGLVIPMGYRAERGIFIVYSWGNGVEVKIWLGGIEIESNLET